MPKLKNKFSKLNAFRVKSLSMLYICINGLLYTNTELHQLRTKCRFWSLVSVCHCAAGNVCWCSMYHRASCCETGVLDVTRLLVMCGNNKILTGLHKKL